MLNCNSRFPRLALVVVLKWVLVSCPFNFSCSFTEYYSFNCKVLSIRKIPTVLLRNSAPRKDHCLTGNPNGCSKLFWGLPQSNWKTKRMFCVLLGSTTVSLVDSVSRGYSNWIFYSFGDYHNLAWRPKMLCALLGSTTVSLVDSVSRGDPNWIFYSSGYYHDLAGRPNKCSVLFWEAPQSRL